MTDARIRARYPPLHDLEVAAYLPILNVLDAAVVRYVLGLEKSTGFDYSGHQAVEVIGGYGAGDHEVSTLRQFGAQDAPGDQFMDFVGGGDDCRGGDCGCVGGNAILLDEGRIICAR